MTYDSECSRQQKKKIVVASKKMLTEARRDELAGTS
jgi:hypothetical protein